MSRKKRTRYAYLKPFRAAVPLWARNTRNYTQTQVSIHCSTKRVNPMRTFMAYSRFLFEKRCKFIYIYNIYNIYFIYRLYIYI